MNCPWCNAEPLDKNKQPYPSLHCYSTKFKCGAMITNVIGSDNPNKDWIEDNRCGDANSGMLTFENMEASFQRSINN